MNDFDRLTVKISTLKDLFAVDGNVFFSFGKSRNQFTVYVTMRIMLGNYKATFPEVYIFSQVFVIEQPFLTLRTTRISVLLSSSEG